MYKSLSARRAWIEIARDDYAAAFQTVALRKESVDRNATPAAVTCAWLVALRKESVDRNKHAHIMHFAGWVALRKESVDRNHELNLDWILETRRSPQGERG